MTQSGNRADKLEEHDKAMRAAARGAPSLEPGATMASQLHANAEEHHDPAGRAQACAFGGRACPSLIATLKTLASGKAPPQADSSLESQVFAERLRLLASHSRGILLPGVVTSMLLGAIHWQVSDHARILAWVGLLVAADLVNFLCCDYWTRHFYDCSPNWRALRSMLFTLALTGMVWGAAPMMLDRGGHLEHELITMLFLCGVTLSTVACFYSFSMVIVTRALALWLPAMVYMIAVGDRMNLYLALSGAAFVASTVQFARRLSAEHVDGLYHLFSNRLLSEQLSESQARLARSNDDLQHKNVELQDALRRIEELAVRDELTGLYNRRFVTHQLDAVTATACRRKRPVSVALVDVDHFKRINDTHGHDVGDEVLKFLARECGSRLRAEDVFARYGGEEFIFILPDSDATAAAEVVERLRCRIFAESQGRCPNGIAVTISVGIAEYDPGESLRDWLHRADEALYRAKHGGRNRVEIAAGPGRPEVEDSLAF